MKLFFTLCYALRCMVEWEFIVIIVEREACDGIGVLIVVLRDARWPERHHRFQYPRNCLGQQSGKRRADGAMTEALCGVTITLGNDSGHGLGRRSEVTLGRGKNERRAMPSCVEIVARIGGSRRPSADRQSVVTGKRVDIRVELGGSGSLNK